MKKLTRKQLEEIKKIKPVVTDDEALEELRKAIEENERRKAGRKEKDE